MSRVTWAGDTMVVGVPNQVSARLGGEFAILHLGSGQYHGLRGVGARVWELLSQPIKVRTIEDTLVQEFDVNPAVLHGDLLRLLDGLLERGLIEVREDPGVSHNSGVSE